MQRLFYIAKKQLPLLDQGLVSGASFLLTIALTRIMGLDQFGVFAAMWLCILFAFTLHQATVIQPMQTLIPASDNSSRLNKSYITIHLIVTAVLSIVMTFVINSISPWLGIELKGPQPMVGWAIAGYSTHEFWRKLNYINNEPGRALIADVIMVLSLAASIGIMGLGNTVHPTMAMGLVAFSYSTSTLLFIRKLIKLSWPSTADWWSLWQFSKWLIGTALLQWFGSNWLILAAGSILGPAVLGLIRICQNLVGVLHVLFLAIENVAPSVCANLLNNNSWTDVLAYLKSIGWKYGWILGGLILIILLWGENLLISLYGIQSSQATSFLQALALTYLLVLVGTLLRIAVRTLHQNHFLFIGNAICMVAGFFLAKPLITSMGTIGVAVGLAILQIIMLAVLFTALKTNKSIVS